MGNPFIDFHYVKSNADVIVVLDALGIATKSQSGNEVRIQCVQPDHEDKKASCDVNTEKKAFHCKSCNARGSILDLVATFRGCELRSAAEEIADICNISVSDRTHTRKSAKQRKSKTADSTNKPDCATHTHTRSGKQAEPEVPFEPFTTVLKLDAKHQFGIDRDLNDALISTFEMGFQDRGLFKDRWCVPVHDPAGDQLGYTGRWAKKHLPKDAEKWLLPKSFPKQEVLFNAHRVEDRIPELGLIMVEGALDTVRLHGLGFPVVGLLGNSISEQQIQILLGLEIEFIILMMDGDKPGRKAVPSLLEQLSREFFVRDVKLPDGVDPENVPEDFLQEHVWGL